LERGLGGEVAEGKFMNVDQLITHLFRQESGKLVSILTNVFGTDRMEMAEDVVQDSFIEAVRQWPLGGVPDNPSGWLYTVAKNKAYNIIKREQYQREYAASMQPLPEPAIETILPDHLFTEQHIQDDQLRMIFVCCHPSLSPDAQVSLTLKTLCGFSIKEIANAFLTNEETINKRLVRARQKIREENISVDLPPAVELDSRVHVVLKAIYLLFNEGYSATTGDQQIRYELCAEAMRLCGMLVTHAHIGNREEALALLALMQLNASRFAARQDAEGNVLTLEQQDRSAWNAVLIIDGLSNLEKSVNVEQLTIYHILATISAYHCMAPDFASTDWPAILSLYDHLTQLDHSPLVLLNRAIAVAKVRGVAAAMRELEELKKYPALQSYPLFFATQAQFYTELDQYEDAAASLEKAIGLTVIPGEQKLLKERLDACYAKMIRP
jgi:RNA polymerase sigma factor (sigma-70 family)